MPEVKSDAIRIAEQMLGIVPLPASLAALIEKADARVQRLKGDGGVYGHVIRSTQVVAGLIASWEIKRMLETTSGKRRSKR